MIARNSCLPPIRNDWIKEHFKALEPVIEYHANRLARTHRAFRQDQPSIANELWQEIVRKSGEYDPAKASPRTFARLICQCKIISILRAQNAPTRGHKRTQEFSAFDSDRPIEATLDHRAKGRHRGHASEDRHDLAIDVRDICNKLPRRLRPLAQKLQEVTPAEAARKLRLSPEELADQLEAIRKRFQRADLDRYHSA